MWWLYAIGAALGSLTSCCLLLACVGISEGVSDHTDEKRRHHNERWVRRATQIVKVLHAVTCTDGWCALLQWVFLGGIVGGLVVRVIV